MSAAQARRRQKLSAAQNVEWMRAERDRRRVAATVSRQQHRDVVGFRVVALPSLADALAEVAPPCL